MATQSHDAKHPLLATLPPATDYLTYLTVVENNLSEENLPLLHELLQDTELTTNIGWDLIHLLVPLLPASEECLDDVAERGNPREVILKVTEELRLLKFEDPDDVDSEEEEAGEDKVGSSAGDHYGETNKQAPASPPLPVLQFDVLLSLLSMLHGRIKTKYPSRFLSTSLQAVLVAYSKAKKHQDELTVSTAKFVKTLSGTKRPHLPPRTSSGNLLRRASGPSQPDPEAQDERPPPEETTLMNRLLQSFITHILEDYVLSLSSEDDVPGMAYSSRLMEKFQPERVVPGKFTYAKRFAEEEPLVSRTGVLGQLVAIAQDLGLSNPDLLQTIMDPESEESGIPGEESDPPSSAEEIPLSKTGSLFLYAARRASEELFSTTAADDVPKFYIFPHHATLVKNFLGPLGVQTIGLDAEALLDAVLSLGLIALEKNQMGNPADDEEFENHLRALSLISANTPSPSLRYQAHYLASTILRSHPSDVVRLSFIRSTLEDCPYENLKASAVGWLKGETLEANMPLEASQGSASDERPSIFATPVALSTVSPFLFPDLSQKLGSMVELSEMWTQFRMELGFYLAALNFYYLLLTAKIMHENLDVPSLYRDGNIKDSYLDPLRGAISRLRAALAEGGELAEKEDTEGQNSNTMDLERLEYVLDRVDQAIKGLDATQDLEHHISNLQAQCDFFTCAIEATDDSTPSWLAKDVLVLRRQTVSLKEAMERVKRQLEEVYLDSPATSDTARTKRLHVRSRSPKPGKAPKRLSLTNGEDRTEDSSSHNKKQKRPKRISDVAIPVRPAAPAAPVQRGEVEGQEEIEEEAEEPQVQYEDLSAEVQQMLRDKRIRELLKEGGGARKRKRGEMEEVEMTGTDTDTGSGGNGTPECYEMEWVEGQAPMKKHKTDPPTPKRKGRGDDRSGNEEVWKRAKARKGR
ncbi:DUF1760-domain-containing protein [Delitschia confertaspora ATCC 74209]|uniref:DUF1760-domain-containing protein n=1 Tax=Delitschia confertaspora ATCC 74209 TaxID=1513339 RepID=A0A9P4MNP7_9PLEO|nr:DUF1760-domain-containing protein [Delitschia confertaspora ATCC 74209]